MCNLHLLVSQLLTSWSNGVIAAHFSPNTWEKPSEEWGIEEASPARNHSPKLLELERTVIHLSPKTFLFLKNKQTQEYKEWNILDSSNKLNSFKWMNSGNKSMFLIDDIEPWKNRESYGRVDEAGKGRNPPTRLVREWIDDDGDWMDKGKKHSAGMNGRPERGGHLWMKWIWPGPIGRDLLGTVPSMNERIWQDQLCVQIAKRRLLSFRRVSSSIIFLCLLDGSLQSNRRFLYSQ